MPENEAAAPRPRFNIPWYFVTRGIGVLMVGMGLLNEDTPERGTIIITGAGLLGIDKVARTEPPAPPGA